ncbi:hypothetical protein TNCV_2869581 [Trichonephila clavipes]|nr:hypothetical protein TNCV_2869581 [Trichonephila clavipes]
MKGNYLEPNENGELQSVYTVGKDNQWQRSPSFDPSNRITLSWHNINVFVKPEKKRFWHTGKKYDINEQKQLLHGGKYNPIFLISNSILSPLPNFIS